MRFIRRNNKITTLVLLALMFAYVSYLQEAVITDVSKFLCENPYLGAKALSFLKHVEFEVLGLALALL